ncbi:hypothetical protein M9H77_07003 [Catharanthus roseus]|uniref:Uncharacterized protein n=1 Tax=Catharanthus roseus TaxID=4058 RepID=A0ACC0BTY4_CATRO|nr:hypothetical protein M9H77_07003 [Catharanthus roseus]
MNLGLLGRRWELGFQRKGKDASCRENLRDGGIELGYTQFCYCDIGGRRGLRVVVTDYKSSSCIVPEDFLTEIVITGGGCPLSDILSESTKAIGVFPQLMGLAVGLVE